MEVLAVCADILPEARHIEFISDPLDRLMLKAGLASCYGVLVVTGCSTSVGWYRCETLRGREARLYGVAVQL
jgi:hypothetical protein